MKLSVFSEEILLSSFQIVKDEFINYQLLFSLKFKFKFCKSILLMVILPDHPKVA